MVGLLWLCTLLLLRSSGACYRGTQMEEEERKSNSPHPSLPTRFANRQIRGDNGWINSEAFLVKHDFAQSETRKISIYIFWKQKEMEHVSFLKWTRITRCWAWPIHRRRRNLQNYEARALKNINIKTLVTCFLEKESRKKAHDLFFFSSFSVSVIKTLWRKITPSSPFPSLPSNHFSGKLTAGAYVFQTPSLIPLHGFLERILEKEKKLFSALIPLDGNSFYRGKVGNTVFRIFQNPD